VEGPPDRTGSGQPMGGFGGSRCLTQRHPARPDWRRCASSGYLAGSRCLASSRRQTGDSHTLETRNDATAKCRQTSDCSVASLEGEG
jgi:hypothetical protein